MNEKIVGKHKEGISLGKGTLAIILINIVLFIALNTAPGLRENLLLNHEISMILEKPWTLITVFLSHEVFIHLIFNMGIFFFFGSRLEKITSAKTVAIVYLIAGLIGSITFLFTSLIVQRTGLMTGASAAVFGIVGTFATLRPNAVLLGSKAKLWTWVLVIFTVLLAVINPQTLGSAVAHVIGVFVGIICGYWLKNKEDKKARC
ncbi:MAG TPA: rhomboid family intramembrane serine protease [Clostridiaceae bacterium]|nr:rhomboid family intramembrane serine protease [Clostridiaceae bacterium]